MVASITIILVTIILCVTFLIHTWRRKRDSSHRRLLRIISKLRKENSDLRYDISYWKKDTKKVYEEWFEDFSNRQKTLDETLYKIYELTKGRVTIEVQE